MSEQSKFTYHEASQPLRSSDALLYEEAQRHAMPHETPATPEQQFVPGEWEQPFLKAATAQLVYYRLAKLAESGNEDARRALEQRAAVESQQLTQTDFDRAA